MQEDTLNNFDYHLPTHLIAAEPVEPRDASKLLCLTDATFQHRSFHSIDEHFSAGDVLVINRTKVFKARIRVPFPEFKSIEFLVFKALDASPEQACLWQALAKPGKKLKPGMQLQFHHLVIEVVSKDGKTVTLKTSEPLWPLLEQFGEIPLPPYLNRSSTLKDETTYQTVFAEKTGAVAAPTASLHFTDNVLEKLKAKGVQIVDVLLHVGPGTFLPIQTDNYREHTMHHEYYEVPFETQNVIKQAQQQNRRIIAVGTTVVRALETWAQTGDAQGETQIFIYPGFIFRCVNALITNFHLPKSTLLLLVCAFAGKERILKAYEEAIAKEYRFFSYGDAMLIY